MPGASRARTESSAGRSQTSTASDSASLEVCAPRLVSSSERPRRTDLPRFTGENVARNQSLVDALGRLAAERGVSPSQLAVAWVRAKSAHDGTTITPTLGARTRAQLGASAAP